MNLFKNLVRPKLPGGWAALAALALLLFVALSPIGAHAAAAYLVAYPAAPYDGASGTFTLKADDTAVPVTSFYGGRYSFGHLAFEGTTTFTLSVRSGAAITSYDISPHPFGVKGTVDGPNLKFTVTQGRSTYLIVNVSTSAGALQPMVIAGDPRETDVPVVGDKVHDITAAPYNADKTGNKLLNTTIQNAIHAVSSAGGGTLYFPAGVYKISNNIHLESNVTFYLAPGAFLRGSSNRGDYTWNSDKTSAGDPKQGPQNFLITGKVENVAFTGRGTVDANSTVLVTPEKKGGKVDGWGGYRKGIFHSGASGGNKPDGIRIVGITVKDATTWSFDIDDARNITIQNVKLVNDFNWIHSDGYDIVSSTNALVDNCLGVTGDDVFDAKSNEGLLSNVTYSNDVAYSHDGTGTKLGMASKGTADNVTFSHIYIVAGQRAVSVSHDEGTGHWSNLHFDDIWLETLAGSSRSGEFLVAPIVIWTLGGGAGPVNGVSLSRVTVENSRGFTSHIEGATSGATVSDITLQDVTIDGTAINAGNAASKISVGANVKGLKYGLVSGAVYTLVSEHNGLALDNGNVTAGNTPVIEWTVNTPSTATQQWKLNAINGNTYAIVSQKSGHALDNSSARASGSGLIQWPANGQVQQQWTITPTGNGWYEVTSVQSGLALDDDDVPAGTRSDTAQVVQFTPNGNATQRWKLTKQ